MFSKALPTPCPSRRGRLKKGLSLVELMLVLLIGLVVGAVVLSIYQINARYYLRRDALSEQRQNLKTAFDSFREISLSGNIHRLLGPGVQRIQIYIPETDEGGHWFQHPGEDEPGALPLFGRDGGPAGADEVSILGAALETGQAAGRLALAFRPGGEAGRSLYLTEDLRPGALAAGDPIVISDGRSALIVEAGEIVDGREIVLGRRFRPDEPLPAPLEAFPPGSSVFNLRELVFVTYYLDQASGSLMARRYDGLPFSADRDLVLAANIEDLQIRYLPDDGTLPGVSAGADWLGDAALAGVKIKALHLALVSRSSYWEKAAEAELTPALFNRLARPADQRRRLIMTESIFLINAPDRSPALSDFN